MLQDFVISRVSGGLDAEEACVFGRTIVCMGRGLM